MATAVSKRTVGKPKKVLTQSLFTPEQVAEGEKILSQDVAEFSLGVIVLEFLDFLRSLHATWFVKLLPSDLIVHPENLVCIRV